LAELQLQITSKTEHDDKQVDQILIVDDSPTVIAIARKMLDDRYDVVSAENGLVAWDI